MREQASGEHALVMLKPLTGRTHALADAATRRWHEAFAFQLRKEFSTLDGELVVELLQQHENLRAQAHHREAARRFAAAHLQLADSHWALWHCVIDAATSSRLSSVDEIDRNLLITIVLQQRELPAAARLLGFNSNADAELALRRAISQIL